MLHVALNERALLADEMGLGKTVQAIAACELLYKSNKITKEEHEQLQKWLASMRMICDSPYILDLKCKISPKIKEL